MNRERFLRVLKFILYLDFFLLCIYFAFFGISSWREFLSKLGILITASSLAVYLFDKWLWKYFPFKLLAGLPQIEGEWEVEIVNLADRKPQKSKMKINQTFFSVSIETDAERGNSETIIGDLVKLNSTWRLIWTWESISEGSSFYGTTMLDIKEGRQQMEGLYFTNSRITGNRCTSGKFIAKKSVRKQK